ncbi:MAG: DUF4474 domain-containing protein [Oscillospiraceae bacterium]|jgi:hypothetical protein|nr:DUF4474 domain-containing protein [Oscillospiraceae bacterium]
MRHWKNCLIKSLSCFLAAVLLTAPVLASAPAAAPQTTPEEEYSALASSQRSINNPNGSFTLPDPFATTRFLNPKTWEAGRLILNNVIQQLLHEDGDTQAIQRIFEYMPIVRADDPLPEKTELPESGLSPILFRQGAHNYYFVLRETDEEHRYDILLIYSDQNGRQYYTGTDICYESGKGLLYAQNGKGLLNTGFDFESGQYLVRTSLLPWPKAFGYHIAYDYLTFLVMIFIDTLRFPFEYDGKGWQIQLWKGIYPFMNGAEIGLYERIAELPGNLSFYNGTDLHLKMSMELYQGDRLIFDYANTTWWLAAFQINHRGLRPRSLRLKGTILFEEAGMLEAFAQEVRRRGYQNFRWEVDGENPLLFRYEWLAD